MQVQHGADQGIKNNTSSNKRLRSLKFSQRWKQEKLDKKGFVIKFKVSHSVENRRSWTTSMQWRANVQNGFTTGIQTCLWLRWWETWWTQRLWWFVFKMRVHTYNYVPSGDIGLGRLPSLAGLWQERKDGAHVSNGGAVFKVLWWPSKVLPGRRSTLPRSTSTTWCGLVRWSSPRQSRW